MEINYIILDLPVYKVICDRVFIFHIENNGVEERGGPMRGLVKPPPRPIRDLIS